MILITSSKHPSQWLGENFLASGRKLKESNTNGAENPLLLMGWEEFYYLQLENPVKITKISVFFLLGMRVYFQL